MVKTRIAPAGTGIEVLVYAADQKDLFARICSFFDRVDCNIVEARIIPLVTAMRWTAFSCSTLLTWHTTAAKSSIS